MLGGKAEQQNRGEGRVASFLFLCFSHALQWCEMDRVLLPKFTAEGAATKARNVDCLSLIRHWRFSRPCQPLLFTLG